MPFSGHSGLVAIFSKEVPKSLLGCVHHGTARTGSVSTGNTWMVAGHQSSPRRCAKGADMKIGETDGFGVQAVKVWRFKDGVSMATEVSVTLIIRHHHNDIGSGISAPTQTLEKPKTETCIENMKKVLIHKQKWMEWASLT
jgi:hypothetical protein